MDLQRVGLDVALVEIPALALAKWSWSNSLARWPRGENEIAGGLFIGELPDEVKSAVELACSRLGNTEVYNVVPLHYAFWQVVPADASELAWDLRSELRSLMQVARLVRLHSGDLSWAATVRGADGKVVATPARFERHTHSCLANGEEGWLRPQDIADVGALWRSWKDLEATKAMPNRASRALWLFEYVQTVYEIDIRWPLLGTALEALIKIRDDKKDGGSSAVFCDRGAALAKLAGVDWDPIWLLDVYSSRSLLAHGHPLGEGPETLPAAALQDYIRFEDGLRRILRAIVERPEVRTAVSSDDAIRAHFGSRSKRPSP